MSKTKKQLEERYFSRRQFLYGVGAGLALPPLVSMFPSKAFAQAAPVRRLCMLASEFGMWTDHVAPDEVTTLPHLIEMSKVPGLSGVPHAKYAALANLPKVNGGYSYIAHSGLSDLFPHMNLYQGLDNCSYWGHSFGLYSGGFGGRAPDHGRSIDYIIEESAAMKSGFKGPLPTIRMMNARWKTPVFHSRNRDAAGNFLLGADQVTWPEYYLSDGYVFDLLFKTATTTSTSTVTVSKSNLLIDRVIADFNALKNHSRISSSDKKLLEEYGENIFEIQKGLVSPTPTQTITCGKPAMTPHVPTLRETASDLDLFSENIYKMTVVAFACDLSRTLAYHYFPYGAAHHEMDGSEADHYGSKHQRAFIDVMADKLVRKLRDTTDPINGGSLLDNTFVIYGNEHSGRYHSPMDLPLISFGGFGGKVRTGQFFDFRRDEERGGRKGFPMKMMLATLLEGMGVTRAEYMKEGDGNGLGSWGDYGVGNVFRASEYAPYFATNHSSPLPYFTKA